MSRVIRPERSQEGYSRGAALIRDIWDVWKDQKADPNPKIAAIMAEYDLTFDEWYYWSDIAGSRREWHCPDCDLIYYSESAFARHGCGGRRTRHMGPGTVCRLLTFPVPRPLVKVRRYDPETGRYACEWVTDGPEHKQGMLIVRDIPERELEAV